MSAAVSNVGSQTNLSEREIRAPGEVGIWVFIFGDMAAFAALFSNYLYYRGKQPDLFAKSQEALNLHFGAANTLILLLSSLLVVLAVGRMRAGMLGRARGLLAGAFGCGVAFSVLKLIEYHDKIVHQLTPTKNGFFTYYFVLTGLHWVHVVIGLGVLSFLFSLTRKKTLTPNELMYVEAGACYWHMVDLIWIVLFPLLYLVK